jgi:hypothetical protein
MPRPPEEARRALEPIEHIVVLVLENRFLHEGRHYRPEPLDEPRRR